MIAVWVRCRPLYLAVAAIVLVAFGAARSDDQIEAVVGKVIDGDTLYVGPTKIRLEGIAAPELDEPLGQGAPVDPPPRGAREAPRPASTTGGPGLVQIVDFLSRQISGCGMSEFFLEPSAVTDVGDHHPVFLGVRACWLQLYKVRSREPALLKLLG